MYFVNLYNVIVLNVTINIHNMVLFSAQMYGLLSDVPEECDEVCTWVLYYNIEMI